MATATSPATTARGVPPLRAGEGHSFLLRKLHSLTGIVPIGAFLVEHIISNFEAIHGPLAYAQQVGWTKGLDLQPYHAFWGGEVAANRLLHHLEPQTATIYARDTPKQLIAEYRMRADVNGDVEILDAFWNPNHVPTIRDVVPPILAFADLTTTTDGRNLEAAKMIYDEYIEPAFRN